VVLGYMHIDHMWSFTNSKRIIVSGRVYTKNDYQYITVNAETKSKTVTSLISRSIKPGYEKDYDGDGRVTKHEGSVSEVEIE
jgi:hypothetical protein